MSAKYLGLPFDIHAGGIDLVFPHHENELAQAEAAYGSTEKFAKYWLHNGHLNIRGQKMSKSLNNSLMARDIMMTMNSGVIRFFLLSAHYRSPLDWTEENVASAVAGYNELRYTLSRAALALDKPAVEGGSPDAVLLEKGKAMEEAFVSAMDDDFNTASAIAALFTCASEIKNSIKKKDFVLNAQNREVLKLAAAKLASLGGALGFRLETEDLSAEALALAAEREKARKIKDFKASDELRAKLDKLGYIAEDSRMGQMVFKK